MSDAGAAQRAHARLQAILKAVVVGQDVSDPASREAGESTTLFSSAGALEPPYDPAALCLLVEHSNALRQNLDAYAVNIDGFGHRLEPAIDFEAEDADARVADAIFLERSAALERGELKDGAELEPTDEEVAARKRDLIHLARVERARLQSFFDFCCFDHSFVDLRRRTRQDLETTGNAYWEVLRDGRGEIAQLVYSIGLIDYFADNFVVSLLDYCYELLAPGGKVILGNFHPQNTTRALMEYILDWKLIHRDEHDMNRLMAASR